MDLTSDKRTTRITFEDLGHLGQSSRPQDPAPRPGSQLPSPRGRSIKSETKRGIKRKGPHHEQSPAARSAPLELHLPKATAAGIRAYEYVKTLEESPWGKFQKIYELKLDAFTIVAIRRALPREIVIIKEFEGVKEKLKMLQQIRHDNILPLLECFHFGGVAHVVFEHISISLTQIAASPPYPTEPQLAATLGQILSGLIYLGSKGLSHGSLTCSNVLVSPKGLVKLSNQECCTNRRSTQDEKEDIRAVGRIAIMLMQKYFKDDDTVGVEDLKRWPSDSKAVSFLSDTTSAGSLDELKRHPLTASLWHTEDLKWLVELAAVSVRRNYQYRH